MSIAHLLEDFTLQAGGGKLHLLDEDGLEEQRLAAFEQGYAAGWEDAVQAQEQNRGRISTELAKSLEDMSFTYHEAVTRMTLSLEPMFNSLMLAVLPETLERGYTIRLAEQLTDMAREQINEPMQVFVPEGLAAEVKEMLPEGMAEMAQVISDPQIKPGQARLQIGISRREVDCGGLLTSIRAAFDAFVFEAKEALSNE
ncbi:ABC transporter ATP-binding protein [Ruegeria lacuscaerulensis]|uniref:ABC transporter ATP-binding protein n=1 Tax=Ruegeria lacuscaerulensis TaxID=55218 RepID=UPI00148020CC|nr:ABC transporter ATP-binding protein [Ruegeria lacuscaerulensis]